MQQLPTAAPEVVRSPQSPELDLAAPADVRDTSGFSNYTLMSPWGTWTKSGVLLSDQKTFVNQLRLHNSSIKQGTEQANSLTGILRWIQRFQLI